MGQPALQTGFFVILGILSAGAVGPATARAGESPKESAAEESPAVPKADQGGAKESAPAESAPKDKNGGQEALDRAIEAKLDAKTLADLSWVIKLCQNALERGLDEANTEFAKKLVASTLVQRASAVSREIFDRVPVDPRWEQFRIIALRDLEQAIQYDPALAEAHFLIGRLQSLPRGDRPRALKALDEAVRLYAGNDADLAKTLLIRAAALEDAEKRLADYNEAVRLSGADPKAIRERALFQAERGKLEEALADLDAAIKLDPTHAETHEIRAVVLSMMKRYDEAMASAGEAIRLAPKSGSAYAQRAKIHILKKDYDKAMAALDQALAVDPENVSVLLLRSSLHQQQGKMDKALADADQALLVRPGLVAGLQIRAILLASSGKFDQAIADLEKIRADQPKNVEVLGQLAMIYSAAKRTDKAIEAYTAALAEDPKSGAAYRGRADAYLAVGRQAEAIADYEAALKIKPDDSGVLNNLAWVLATSPDDKLRNGKRAIELATEACRVTEYKQAHILSTLAAGYAEAGDFEAAKRWSKKAVELGEKEQKEALGKELKSYESGKPWRETQTPADLPEGGAAEGPAKETQPGGKAKPEEAKPETPAPEPAKPEEPAKPLPVEPEGPVLELPNPGLLEPDAVK
ncbi:MAG: tetratricopeptide repeat protein [Pirellulales bacterium]